MNLVDTLLKMYLEFEVIGNSEDLSYITMEQDTF